MKNCFLIAEIGQAHDGSVGIAESLCHSVAKSGFDSIKFQMHLAEEESTLDEEFRAKFSYVDKTRFDYWKRTSFSNSEWRHLINLAKKLNLKVGISPFSKKAVDLCRKLKVDFIKIGSGEVFNEDLINYLDKKDNVIISSGMSTFDETLGIANYLSQRVKNLSITHCHSSYPCELKDLNLVAINYLKKKTGLKVGYSDHSGNINVGFSSIAYGAEILEVHCTYSRDMFGPDSKSSLNFEELSEISKFRDIYFAARGKLENIDKRKHNEHIKNMKETFGRSICLKSSLPKGIIIQESEIVMKKPSGGFNFNEKDKIINQVLAKDYNSKFILKKEDLHKLR